ncbi:MAG: large repetitive protein [Thermodesulfobacteriota bacterium]|nr:large repetitive protein [Thermodesulfobacteriota bacterium]
MSEGSLKMIREFGSIKGKGICVIFFFLCGLFTLGTAWGYGNISVTYKYGWSENSGWVNFHPTYGGVTVHSTYLSGYAWAQNFGWIKLGSGSGPYQNTNSANWGVNLDSSTGAFSGYAWSENTGWINFKPTHGGVTMNLSTGRFDGYAWGQNIGWIHFQNASPEYYVMRDSSLTLYVNKDDSTCGGNTPCYASIQEAVDLANTESTIRIAQGTYSEVFSLDESKTLILTGGWDVTFTSQAPNTTIIKAPGAPQGSLTLQMMTIRP